MLSSGKEVPQKSLESSRVYIRELQLQRGEKKTYTAHKFIIKKNKRVKWILVNK